MERSNRVYGHRQFSKVENFLAITTVLKSFIEDIKKNVQELANIATQDDVSEEKIMMIRQKAKLNRGLQQVEEY